MTHVVQQAIVTDFNESISVLFSTDLTARGLDIKNVDWVVQVDCPESIDNYIHRVGRTAHYNKKGKSLMFLCPEEEAMFEKFKATESKIPIHIRKLNAEQLEQISQSIAPVLVKFCNLHQLGKRAFVTYLKSLYLQKDKKVLDLNRFSAEQFAAYAASLGLPVTPTICFVRHNKNAPKKDMEDIDMKQMKSSSKSEVIINPQVNRDLTLDDGDDGILYPKKSPRQMLIWMMDLTISFVPSRLQQIQIQNQRKSQRLVKILKKYDKRTGALIRLPIIQNVMQEPFFTMHLLYKLVKECKAMLDQLLPRTQPPVPGDDAREDSDSNDKSVGASSSLPNGSGALELEEIEDMESAYMKSTVAALKSLREIRGGSSTPSAFSLPPLQEG